MQQSSATKMFQGEGLPWAFPRISFNRWPELPRLGLDTNESGLVEDGSLLKSEQSNTINIPPGALMNSQCNGRPEAPTAARLVAPQCVCKRTYGLELKLRSPERACCTVKSCINLKDPQSVRKGVDAVNGSLDV